MDSHGNGIETVRCSCATLSISHIVQNTCSTLSLHYIALLRLNCFQCALQRVRYVVDTMKKVSVWMVFLLPSLLLFCSIFALNSTSAEIKFNNLLHSIFSNGFHVHAFFLSKKKLFSPISHFFHCSYCARFFIYSFTKRSIRKWMCILRAHIFESHRSKCHFVSLLLQLHLYLTLKNRNDMMAVMIIMYYNEYRRIKSHSWFYDWMCYRTSCGHVWVSLKYNLKCEIRLEFARVSKLVSSNFLHEWNGNGNGNDKNWCQYISCKIW